MISALLQEPVMQRLGWTLLHSLWQIAVLGVVAGVFLAMLRRRPPAARYLVAYAGMMVLPVSSMLTFVRLGAGPGAVSGDISMISIPAGSSFPLVPISSAGQLSGHSSLVIGHGSLVDAVLPWATLAWMAGVVVLSLRLLLGYGHLRRLRRTAEGVPVLWERSLGRLAGRLAISRPVRLLQSALVEVPTAIGELRPMVLIPASALTGLAPEHLEALLAHELAHIRRHDYLANLIQCFVETVLFYHPVVWWLSGRVRQEREHCCDDLAAAACGNRLMYADALSSMEHLRGPEGMAASFALATHTTSLLPRIRRLLGLPAARPSRAVRWFSASSACAALGFIVLVLYIAACDRSNVTLPKAMESTRPASTLAALDNSASGVPATVAGTQGAEAVVVHVYDVRDLLAGGDQNVAPPQLGLPPAGSGGHFPAPALAGNDTQPSTTAESSRSRLQIIINTIESTVAPDMWRYKGGTVGVIRELSGQLIIAQTEENHKKIVDLLAQLRQAHAVQISFEARVLVLSEAMFKACMPAGAVERSSTSPSVPPGQERVLEKADVANILRAVEADLKSSIITAPRMTLFNGQDGFVALTSQQNLITDCHINKDPDGPSRYTLDVSTLRTGIVFQIQATISRDLREVRTKFGFDCSVCDRIDFLPVPGMPADANVVQAGEKLQIQSPHLSGVKFETLASIPDGGTLLFGGLKIFADVARQKKPIDFDLNPLEPSTEPHYLLLLVTPKVIVPQEKN